MHLRRFIRPLFVAATVGCWCVPALAASNVGEGAPRDSTEAQRLFEQALGLLDRNQAQQACPMLAKSLELDPGIGTEFQLADCYERIGKRATAYRLFDEVARRCAAIDATEHEQVATQRKRALEGQLEYVELEILRTRGDLAIAIDGTAIARTDWARPLPMDPGVHAFEVRIDGRVAQTGTFGVVPGERRTTLRIDVPMVAPDVSAPAGTVAVSDHGGRTSTQRTLSYVTLAGGVVGLSVGGVYGLVALSKKHDSDAQCDETNGRQICNSVDSQQLHNDAVRAGRLSTAFFAAGTVLTATGVVLLLTVPKVRESTVSAGIGFAPNGAFARLGGRF